VLFSFIGLKLSDSIISANRKKRRNCSGGQLSLQTRDVQKSVHAVFAKCRVLFVLCKYCKKMSKYMKEKKYIVEITV
jgi:translation initiation factor 2 beta subunit (eIF-2beta)/eIF-5